MKITIKDRLLEKYTSEKGTFYFYQYYILGEINEGQSFNSEVLESLIPIAYKHYGSHKPFSYISNRKNSYSVSPLEYLKHQDKFPENFKAYAIVTHKSNANRTIEYEKHFAQKPFKQFYNIEKAIRWVKDLCQ